MTPADIYLQAWICQLAIAILYPFAIGSAVILNGKISLRSLFLAFGMTLMPLLALYIFVEAITAGLGIAYPSITDSPQEIQTYVFLSKGTAFDFLYLGQVLVIVASQVGLLTIAYRMTRTYSQTQQSEIA